MRWIAILAVIMQVGCAGSHRVAASAAPEMNTAVVETALTQNRYGATGLALPDNATDGNNALYAQGLLALSPEMKAFVASVDPSLSPQRRFRRLVRTLKMDRFELEYDLNNTTTAAEAFAQRRGNCISFAALIVALAREVGLEAHFNRVEAPQERRATAGARGKVLVQNILHINAEVTYGWTTRVFEFNFEPRPDFPHHRLADETVQALYLNNRALELAKTKQWDGALSMLSEAITLTPATSLLWNSLGYIHRQTGNLELAEISYTQALALDSDNQAARNNLRRVYELQSKRSLSRAAERADQQEQGS
ncbi:transglutaminase domain-containing protein [Microbulbifer sp. Q7]|uniref:transglutaminase domain-containing protein n=1 Tax=Microbulbifer sp. Q7 TaxID=1785091 RepID=UPI0009ED782D|nr:transglutaminase domain-containing protein [Microbulbifer sp. Q7]